MTEPAARPTAALGIGRRHFLVGMLLAGTSVGSFAALPKVRHGRIEQHVFESWIPVKVGSWTFESVSGVVLPPPDALSDRLYDNLVYRVYQMPGEPDVMMVIAYNNNQDGMLQLHRPEVCYPAGGYKLSPTDPVELVVSPSRKIPANVFTAIGSERTEQVLYWTRLGNDFPQSWIDQRLSVMGANLHGDIPDGAMMRVSLIGQDQDRSLAILRKFLATFLTAAPSQLQRVLLGWN